MAWGRYKYEYKCISQDDKVVAEGELILELPCTIRSGSIRWKGIMAIFEHDHERLLPYRGVNHLKDIKMRVTNVFTKTSRYFEKYPSGQ